MFPSGGPRLEIDKKQSKNVYMVDNGPPLLLSVTRKRPLLSFVVKRVENKDLIQL